MGFNSGFKGLRVAPSLDKHQGLCRKQSLHGTESTLS